MNKVFIALGLIGLAGILIGITWRYLRPKTVRYDMMDSSRTTLMQKLIECCTKWNV